MSFFFPDDPFPFEPPVPRGMWLCPPATGQHCRTHPRKLTTQIPGSHAACGQGFCSSTDVKGGLTDLTKLETCTQQVPHPHPTHALSGAKGKSGNQCQDLPKANPYNMQCTTGTREVMLGQQEEREIKGKSTLEPGRWVAFKSGRPGHEPPAAKP